MRHVEHFQSRTSIYNKSFVRPCHPVEESVPCSQAGCRRAEDPAQRDEKKRLMNLLKAGGEEDPLVGSSGGFGKRRRRSVRIAGF